MSRFLYDSVKRSVNVAWSSWQGFYMDHSYYTTGFFCKNFMKFQHFVLFIWQLVIVLIFCGIDELVSDNIKSACLKETQ